MTLGANTGAVRTAGKSYETHAATCLSLATDVAKTATTISPQISHVGVQTAVGAALLAVLKQLDLAHGAIAHAGGALPQVADALDAADTSAGTKLSSLGTRVPHVD